MIGVLKVAALGAVVSYGAVTIYDLPHRKLEAAVQATGSLNPKPVAATRPVRPVVRPVGAAEVQTSCQPTRRKLWVEGQGWVVRKQCWS